MNTEEAIRILGLECDDWETSHCTPLERREAFEMAITALQVQDKLQDIEYMCRLSGGADYFYAFRALSEKVKNTNTFLNNSHDEVNNSTNNSNNSIKNCVDCISRREAIEKVKKHYRIDNDLLELITYEIEHLPSVQPDLGKYEYHYDHTDCIWYRPEARNRCHVTCAQYRDGWNDAMNYIFRDGKGYRPYRRDKQYEE